MSKLENIILADCCVEEVQSLADSLSVSSKPFAVKSHIANWKRTGKLSEIKRYLKYFTVAFRYFISRKNYDVIVGWQQFYALIFCFFCSLFRVKKRNIVVVLNFTYKEKSGKVSGLYRWFMDKCVKTGYIDYLHVSSEKYADYISEIFSIPRDRVIALPFGINDPFDEFSALPTPSSVTESGYALSIGRSNRDYDFLIDSWKNINYPLVIISDTYTGDNRGNENIRILRNVAGEESYPWIANCSIMIIPIDDGSICSGDTVLLTGMAMKKKIVVTSPSTLAEMYILDKHNGMAVEKDSEKFSDVINKMLYADEYSALGECARESYLHNFSRKSMGEKISDCINGLCSESA